MATLSARVFLSETLVHFVFRGLEQGTTWQNETNARACKGLRTCNAGDYVTVDATLTSDRVCAPCPAGQHSTSGMDLSCIQWISCAPGTFVGRSGTAVVDRRCDPCPSFTFSATANSVTCPGATVCVPGTYIHMRLSPTTDRVCEPCAAGTSFSDTVNAQKCTPVAVCTNGELSAANATHDRVCADPSAGAAAGSTTTSAALPIAVGAAVGGVAVLVLVLLVLRRRGSRRPQKQQPKSTSSKDKDETVPMAVGLGGLRHMSVEDRQAALNFMVNPSYTDDAPRARGRSVVLANSTYANEPSRSGPRQLYSNMAESDGLYENTRGESGTEADEALPGTAEYTYEATPRRQSGGDLYALATETDRPEYSSVHALAATSRPGALLAGASMASGGRDSGRAATRTPSLLPHGARIVESVHEEFGFDEASGAGPGIIAGRTRERSAYALPPDARKFRAIFTAEAATLPVLPRAGQGRSNQPRRAATMQDVEEMDVFAGSAGVTKEQIIYESLPAEQAVICNMPLYATAKKPRGDKGSASDGEAPEFVPVTDAAPAAGEPLYAKVIRTPYQASPFARDDGGEWRAEDTEVYGNASILVSRLVVAREMVALGAKLEGGFFGDVYMGTLQRSGGARPLRVVVKTLKVGGGDGTGQAEEQQRAFAREMGVMAQLSHPNLVSLLAVVTEGVPWLIVMEYMNGGSMEKLLLGMQRPLTMGEVRAMAVQTARGMAYLAAHGVVHRDLAARNVLIYVGERRRFVCKVTDFGLSRVMQKALFLDSADVPLPIRWLAPEVRRGAREGDGGAQR